MEQLQLSGIEHSADTAVRAHVDALLPMLLAMRDRLDEAGAIGREHLARMRTGQPFADSVPCNAMAHVLGMLGMLGVLGVLGELGERGQAHPACGYWCWLISRPTRAAAW